MLSKSEATIAGCLRRLLKNRFILQKRSREWFSHIVDNEKDLQKFIHQMGANLVVNQSLGLAFISLGPPEDEERINYQLGNKITLDKLSTMIMLILSKRRADYLHNPENEICVITKDSLKEELLPLLEHIEKYREDRALEKDLKEPLKNLREYQVLLSISDDQNTFEISSVCDILLPFESTQRVRSAIEEYIKNSTVIDDNESPQEI